MSMGGDSSRRGAYWVSAASVSHWCATDGSRAGREDDENGVICARASIIYDVRARKMQVHKARMGEQRAGFQQHSYET